MTDTLLTVGTMVMDRSLPDASVRLGLYIALHDDGDGLELPYERACELLGGNPGGTWRTICTLQLAGYATFVPIRPGVAQVWWGTHDDPAAIRPNSRRAIPGEVRARVTGDGAVCARCGSAGLLEVDHVIPLARFGTEDPENLQPLCPSCNSRKGARQ